MPVFQVNRTAPGVYEEDHVLRLAYKRRRFAFVRELPCFWCDNLLFMSTATADHIKPRWMGGTSSDDNLELACRGCNETRRRISSIASRIQIALQNKKGRRMNSRRLLLAGAIRERDGLLDFLLEVERVYHARLEGKRLDACLREIDYILKAEMF